jgi:hypothetical protein
LDSAALAAKHERVARNAETQRDAKTLAYFSSYWFDLANAEESARHMDEAVAMDPSLTWIFARGVDFRFATALIPQKHDWVRKLEAWDPENATPYLVEASIRQSELYKQSNYNYASIREKVATDPAWRMAMEKAFAAPRYDTYEDQSIELVRNVLAKNDMRRLQDVEGGFFPIYFSFTGRGAAEDYSKLLMREAKEAQKRGDLTVATRNAWAVARFAEQMRTNPRNEIGQWYAEGILLSAYEFLQPLETAAGHANMAKFLAVQNASLTRSHKVPFSVRLPLFYGDGTRSNATSVAFQLGALGVALFGGAMIVSLLWLALGRASPGLREGRLYRWACNSARFAPACFAGSLAVLAFAFQPYREALNTYFANGGYGRASLRTLMEMEWTLSRIPDQFFGAWRHYGPMYLWEFLMAVVVILGVLVVFRSSIWYREPRVKAA